MMQRATVPSPRHRRRQVNHDDIFFFLTSTRVQIQDMCMSNALAVWRSLQRITYVVDKKKKHRCMYRSQIVLGKMIHTCTPPHTPIAH